MKELLKKLTSVTGPSGYETEIRNVILEEVKAYVDDTKVDALGNLITTKGKKTEDGKVIMLAAHMDEIGLIVTHVDENGFARFTNLGGVFPGNTKAARVRFMNGAVGVIGSEPITNRTIIHPLTKQFIDFGVDSREDCPVEIGNVASFERTFEDMGKRVVSKALDDRIGCLMLIEIMKRLKNTPHKVVGVFSSQEEVGTRGATAAAFSVKPDIGIAIDVTGTGDTPKNVSMQLKMGQGPAIKVKDSGMLADPNVVAWMEATAKEKGIKVQREILLGGSTDARAMQISREGVAAGCLSIPSRYIHSPSEMLDMDDVENGIELLVAMLSAPVNF